MSAVSKEISISFAFGYDRTDWPTVLDMVHRGRIDPGEMITDVVGLDQLPDAFGALRKPSSQIKLMVRHVAPD